MSELPENPEVLAPLVRHLEAAYPEEGCGVILHGPAGHRVVPLENAYEKYKAVDPAAFPRTARTAYYIHPRDWMRVTEEAEEAGEQVVCIVHSHVNVGAYFSEEDHAMAAPGGTPLFPGVAYLVVAVDEGRANAARLYRWQDGAFHERSVELTL